MMTDEPTPPVPSLPHYATLPGDAPGHHQADQKLAGPLIKMFKMKMKRPTAKPKVKHAPKRRKKEERFY